MPVALAKEHPTRGGVPKRAARLKQGTIAIKPQAVVKIFKEYSETGKDNAPKKTEEETKKKEKQKEKKSTQRTNQKEHRPKN